MATFDYDVVIIGSGFGGSVAAFRAAEKGYRVGVMEAGRRWKDEDIAKTNWDLKDYLWFPAAELYGIQRMEYLDDVLLLCGSGVGGGSHVYGNTLYVPPKKFFDAPGWAGITDWADELAPCYDQARRMLGVVRYPYMPTDVDRYMQQVATEMGRGETFNKTPVGVYFGRPGVEEDDPYFGGVGPRRTGCISCGNCQVGCGHNAKNKVTTNYLYLAEKLGAEIHELHEVYDLSPLDGDGFEVHARHPGWAQRAAHLHRHTYTAEQVIVAAHAYGSSKLLHHTQHEGRLRGLSSELGKRARTNSEQLLEITRPYGQWKRDPEKIHITPGSVAITCGVWPDPVTSIEPVYYGTGSSLFALLFTHHQHGEQKHPTLSWLKELVEHPAQVLGVADPRHWPERAAIMLCMQTTDTSIDLYWHDGLLRSRRGSGAPPSVHIPVVEEFADRLAKKMDSGEGALVTEVINRTATAHFTGGIPLGDSSMTGAVDPYQRVFGQPGLHVMDGSVMPANPGVNPSLTITALAERAMSLWPNKGDPDTRPPLGAGYIRLAPIMPHRPFVPAGAPGELRLDAKKSDIIPEYPY
ncbi:GMC family oxidoreductase [Mesorhizobium sp. B2-4-14]|uniref:GMC family oxidoreductase n=1 Tax=Mesorhizobium sp. B2-4-14 TaxID=2589935 RepID=UPI0011295F55|nr:GMC family oxidoreductase [Mesorhizobium sp. B2-4-14]TPL11495.1 GMC family oxidoreductase [Mesorhizobium sp. B2-4-14]